LPAITFVRSAWLTSWQLSHVAVGSGSSVSLDWFDAYAAPWHVLHDIFRSFTCFLWLKRIVIDCGGKISSLGTGLSFEPGGMRSRGTGASPGMGDSPEV
jgi:hypothetical protein